MDKVTGLVKNPDGMLEYYPNLHDDDQKFDENAKAELYMALSELNQAHHRLQRAKDDIQAFLERSFRYGRLVQEKEERYAKYKQCRDRVQELVQRVVRSTPEIRPKEMKESFNGVAFKRAPDLAYAGGVSSAKGKVDLHGWLLAHGYEREGRFYMHINGSEVEVPVMPVTKVTPTLPSVYK